MSIKNFRERNPVIIGIISIVALAAATTFAFYLDKLPAIQQAYFVEAEFADAVGLVPENQVRVAGIRVGTVESVELDGDRVRVMMEIEDGVKISRDATASIKLATLLGTKFVDIKTDDDGPFLQEGDLISLADTSVPYQIYQAQNQGVDVLEDLDGKALKDLFDELTTLIRVAEDEVHSALEGLDQLGNGLNPKEDEFKQLLAEADELTALLSDEGDEINRLIDSSNEVLASLAQKREGIQSLLESTKLAAGELAGLIRDNRANIDPILNKLHRALVVLERNVEDLDLAFEFAGPSSRYFANIFEQGRFGDIYVCALVLDATCEPDERG